MTLAAPTTTRGSLLLGALAGIAGHALVLAGAFLARRNTAPGEGYKDVGNVLGILVLGEFVVFVAALIAIVVLFVKRRQRTAVGVILGWLVGPIGVGILTLTQLDATT